MHRTLGKESNGSFVAGGLLMMSGLLVGWDSYIRVVVNILQSNHISSLCVMSRRAAKGYITGVFFLVS